MNVRYESVPIGAVFVNHGEDIENIRIALDACCPLSVYKKHMVKIAAAIEAIPSYEEFRRWKSPEAEVRGDQTKISAQLIAWSVWRGHLRPYPPPKSLAGMVTTCRVTELSAPRMERPVRVKRPLIGHK